MSNGRLQKGEMTGTALSLCVCVGGWVGMVVWLHTFLCGAFIMQCCPVQWCEPFLNVTVVSLFQGHSKVVKYLVEYVTQFPSDADLTRYINTLSDKVGFRIDYAEHGGIISFMHALCNYNRYEFPSVYVIKVEFS